MAGLCISVVIISSSTNALQALDGKKQLGRQKLETLTQYLQLKQVPQSLTDRITEFIEYNTTATKSVMGLHELSELPCARTLEPVGEAAGLGWGWRVEG